jgi:eukaryotic-like serine/threonine-protein kinase
VDARSDLYSLGAVGYFLLTGTPVFPGRNAVEVCGHHLHTPPVPPAERLGTAVPAKLSALLLDCLRKDAVERPASARELIARLLVCDDVPAWTEEEARLWWRRHPPAEVRSSRSASSGSSVMTLSALQGGRQEVGSR